MSDGSHCHFSCAVLSCRVRGGARPNACVIDPSYCRLAANADEDWDEEDALLARLDAGLYTLQQCVLVVGMLWLAGDLGVRKRILQLLHQRSQVLASLRSILIEYRANLGEDGACSKGASASTPPAQPVPL